MCEIQVQWKTLEKADVELRVYCELCHHLRITQCVLILDLIIFFHFDFLKNFNLTTRLSLSIVVEDNLSSVIDLLQQ